MLYAATKRAMMGGENKERFYIFSFQIYYDKKVFLIPVSTSFSISKSIGYSRRALLLLHFIQHCLYLNNTRALWLHWETIEVYITNFYHVIESESKSEKYS